MRGLGYRGRDELATLAQALNTMTTRLRDFDPIPGAQG